MLHIPVFPVSKFQRLCLYSAQKSELIIEIMTGRVTCTSNN